MPAKVVYSVVRGGPRTTANLPNINSRQGALDYMRRHHPGVFLYELHLLRFRRPRFPRGDEAEIRRIEGSQP